MKKFFLVLLTLMPAFLAAQNGITISNFAVSGGSVTFNISWNKVGMPTLWLDSAWVFVDYNNAGTMTRLPLLPGATLTAPSAQGTDAQGKEYGIVIEEAGNNQGVWVAGNAREAGSFSATVELPFSGSNVSGACVYASNYPPLGTWNNDMNRLTIVGTPPYTLTLQLKSSAATETVISGSPFILSPDYTLVSFTDKTGAPGLFNCTPPTAPTNLTASSATICDGASTILTATGGFSGSNSKFEWGTGTVDVGGTLTSSDTYSFTPTTTTTYWVRRVSTDGCGTTTEATHMVTVINTPAPVITTPANVCQNVALIFSIASPIANGTYTWSGSAGETSGTGDAIYTVAGNTAGEKSVTVNVQTNTNGLVCTSDNASATATVNETPFLSAPYGGSNNQTVASGVAIEDIKYTTTGATTVTVDNLPTGITANWESNTVTISGTSSASGTKGYTVTASNTNLCPSTTANGTITIGFTTPPYAASTQTWTVGTQIWSDYIKVSACSGTAFTESTTVPYCRNASPAVGPGYLYNAPYVVQNKNLLCPTPWRVPSDADVTTLTGILGCSRAAYDGGVWGGVGHGGAYASGVGELTILHFRVLLNSGTSCGYFRDASPCQVWTNVPQCGMAVRCVK